MAKLVLKCRNCSRIYEYSTPYPTYIGKINEIESAPVEGAPRELHPRCPHCSSHSSLIVSQAAD